MATKKKSKKGKMPAALKAYWAKMRENPKKKRKAKKHKTRKNPTPARRTARKAGSMVKSAGRQVAPLLIDAGLGLLGYGAARMIAGKMRTEAEALRFAKIALSGEQKRAFLAEVTAAFGG
jgi:hypothetical protein